MRGFLRPQHVGPAFALALAASMVMPSVVAACGPSSLERSVIDRVTSEGDLILIDQRRVRLAGVQIMHIRREDWPRSGENIAIGLISDDKDRWSRLPAVVFTLPEDAPPVWLQQRLLERGTALARPESGLGECWKLLTDAETIPRQPLLPQSAEAGRFARVEGPVHRIGQGRSAHFISLYESSGARVAGMIQKRHLKRFKDAGVDVTKLQGHVIRMRGVRSAANATIIPLTLAEQIEIVR